MHDPIAFIDGLYAAGATEVRAEASIHPDPVGEWVVDDLHATDTGQRTLTFAWD